MHEIQNKLQDIIDNLSQEDFIFDFLLSYDQPKSTISRLKEGELNKLQEKGELLLRKKVFFKVVQDNLYESIDTIKKTLSGSKDNPRFIIVTDFKRLLSTDTKNFDSLDIEFSKLPQHYDFFLPLVGVEKTQYQNEKIADIKAANNLARLFDEISKNNKHDTKDEKHALNIFLTRLLFCYFAEDTKIFQDDIFTNSLASHTQELGEDTHLYLEKLFKILNLKNEDRDNSIPEYFKAFPYVNGKLFETVYQVPIFTAKSRKILIDLGKLSWAEINPDIFGSMMQAVMDSEERSNMGSHYTSVPNIMKVINPLFLDDLRKEFEDNIGNKKKLENLLLRISKIKFFDPACGSGNFLIITYKELRQLEIDIIKKLGQQSVLFSNIKLSQFYGIEISDFARETAMLSLYLAEHQMNVLFEKEVGIHISTLPLKLGGNIVCGNATRLDWEQVCPKEEGDEIYLIGNPPYYGSRKQTEEQKEDMKKVFVDGYKSLDYIACWFFKGANYIRDCNAKIAFVSTNSISQGEQVALTWPRVLKDDLEICFAYQSFKWKNNAKDNAGVTVVIIGISNISNSLKSLYTEKNKQIVKKINAYLTEGSKVSIVKRSRAISNLPEMVYGNMPLEGTFLRFGEDDKNIIIKNYPEAIKFIKKVIGGEELLKGQSRYCFWIENDDLKEAMEIPEISKRIEKVKEFRINGGDVARTLANRSHQFRYRAVPKKSMIIVPCTSSENRNYLPIGFCDNSYISINSAQVIYDSDPWVFGIISSHIHMLWIRSTGGRLKTDYRYSSALVYNTFPFPQITEKQKENITDLVYNILDEREKHSEKTLAQMYDPDKMPEGLKQAHHELDLAIEKCYRLKPFESDEERLEYLFALYEKMIEKEKNNS